MFREHVSNSTKLYKQISEEDFNKKVFDSIDVTQDCVKLFEQLNISYNIDYVKNHIFKDTNLFKRKFIEYKEGTCIELPDEWFLIIEGRYREVVKNYYLCDQLDGLKQLLIDLGK